MHFKGGQYKTKKCHATSSQQKPIKCAQSIQKLKCYKNVLQELRLRQKALKHKWEQLKKKT